MKLFDQGFSIVEFMIAIVLGGILVATAGSVYITNKSTFRIQEGLSRIQENARYAVYFLNRELRMAGYHGCSSINLEGMNNLVLGPTSQLIYDNPIFGYDGLAASFSPALPAHIQGKSVANNDVIELRKASNTNVQLRSDMVQPNNPVLVYDRLGIAAGDVVMISDCSVGDIFIAGGNTNATAITHTGNNNTSNNLSRAYKQGAHVMRFVYFSFYIKDTGRTNSNNEPIYALVRQDIDGNEVELVEGIERMKIKYGVDTNNNKAVNQYQTATEVNNANNWDKVISIKINLLFVTAENVANQSQTYEFDGTSYTASDRKLRREWQTLINVNRGMPS